MTGAPPHPPMPWVDESKAEYGQKAAATIPYRAEPPTAPEELVFEGPCPRCEDAFSYRWPLEVVRGLTERRVTVFCRCEGTHAGRPEGRRGCGAYWAVVVEEPADD